MLYSMIFGRCLKDDWKMFGSCFGDYWKIVGRVEEDACIVDSWRFGEIFGDVGKLFG